MVPAQPKARPEGQRPYLPTGSKGIAKIDLNSCVAGALRMNGTTIVDCYLPTFQFSERHECMIAAEPSRAIKAAADYQPDDDRFFRTVIGLREVPCGLSAF